MGEDVRPFRIVARSQEMFELVQYEGKLFETPFFDFLPQLFFSLFTKAIFQKGIFTTLKRKCKGAIIHPHISAIMRYFLSLGSNLGKKRRNLARAALLLRKEGVKILRTTSVYETQPVDCEDQPWFLNQVAEVDTELDPFDLLHTIKKIERRMKRASPVEKGPRTIDIDILLADNAIVETENLVIPHPRMADRNFVLLPMIEIAPEAVHPLLQMNIRELWRRSKDTSAVKKILRKRST